MKLDDYIDSRIMLIILYLFIVAFFGFFLPLAAGFSFHGFEESLKSGLINISDYLGTFLLYVFFLAISILVIIFPISNILLIDKGKTPETQKNPKWHRVFTVSYLFNVEDGALYQLSEALGFKGDKNFMNWSKNILRVIVFSILIFGTIGLFQIANPEFNISGVNSGEGLAQQVTPTSDIIFGSAIPSVAENGFLLFFLFIVLGIVAYFTAKYGRNKSTQELIFFATALIPVAILMGLFWMSLHSIVYGNSDASLLATFIFGFLGTIMTILLGLFLPWTIWHFMNNLHIKMAELITATEDIFFIEILILSVIAILLGSVEFLVWRSKHKKKKPNE